MPRAYRCAHPVAQTTRSCARGFWCWPTAAPIAVAEFSRDYRQQAIVADIAVGRPCRGIAFERFTREGPLALLPNDGRYALVWSVRADTAEKLLALPDAGFLRALRDAVGGRLGEMRSAGPRSAFPLFLRKGPINPGSRVVAIGNAAQALHPVAGQGFNLGLRDAWELAQMLLDVPPEKIGSADFIAAYARKRGIDRHVGDRRHRFFYQNILECLPAACRGARRRPRGARCLPSGAAIFSRAV